MKMVKTELTSLEMLIDRPTRANLKEPAHKGRTLKTDPQREKPRNKPTKKETQR